MGGGGADRNKMPSPFRTRARKGRGTSQHADYDANQGEVRPAQNYLNEGMSSHPIHVDNFSVS